MSTPRSMKGLILQEDGTVTLNTSIPFPSAVPGSATLRVLAAHVNPNLVEILRSPAQGHGFTQPRPAVIGSPGIARIEEVGPDATTLKPGQLVFFDAFIRARDNPDVQILWGAFDGVTPASKSLYANAWRDGSMAEFVRAPLENVYALDEKRLCGSVSDGGLDYSIDQLTNILPHIFANGGLRAVGVEPGETVLVTPATGFSSGAAVSVALAMGAQVIAASRSAAGLERLQSFFPDIRTAQIKDDVEADSAAIAAAAKGCPIDVVFEMSPPRATGSLGITACLLAVKQYGRICIMGSRTDNIPLPFMALAFKNVTIRGALMYERKDMWSLIRLVETGRLKLGKEQGFEVSGTFSLEEWEKAADLVEKKSSFGEIVFIKP